MLSATTLAPHERSAEKPRILILNSLDDRYGSTYRLRAFERYLVEDGFVVTYVSSEKNALYKLWLAIKATRGQYELLYTQKFNPITLLAIGIARLRGKRVIVDWDDIDVGLQKNILMKAISWFCEWVGPYFVTKITTHSERIRSIANKQGHKAELIQQGFHEDLCATSAEARSALRKKYGYTTNDIIVGHICTLTHGGTIDLKSILESWSRISDPKFRFLLIGGGPMEKTVRGWVQAFGLKERLQMTGLLPQKDAIDLLNVLDVGVVLMSDQLGNRERVSLKALEYLAMNVPVAGNLVGESDRLFGHLIHKCGLEQLPDTVQKLGHNRNQKKTSSEVAIYQWSKIAPRLRDVVRQSIQGDQPCR